MYHDVILDVRLLPIQGIAPEMRLTSNIPMIIDVILVVSLSTIQGIASDIGLTSNVSWCYKRC